MAEIAGRAAERRASWAIRTLYAVLALSALAFAGLIVGEVVYALEEDGHVHVEHDHGWYGPLFDAAWIVFLPTFALTLVKSILILKGVDQNWAQVIQGTLIVVVVMVGGLALRQKGKTGR